MNDRTTAAGGDQFSPLGMVPLINGNTYDLGTLPGGYTAPCIRYYILSYSSTRPSGMTVAKGFYPSFLSGSGNYPRSDIAQFVTDVVQGNPLGTPYTIDATVAPSIYLNSKAYVVIQLDPQYEWNFLAAYNAVKVGDSSLSTKYFGLLHYADGSSVGQSPAPASCKMISFATGAPLNVGSDLFNLYLGFDQASGTVPMVLDPEIKNRGGTGPGQ